jgi:RNA polymerase sigma factor (sigma-70 family)
MRMKAENLAETDSETSSSSTSDSDQVLLHSCRAGDEQAWQRLLDKYERLVYSIPLSYGLPREDAADIAQIVFSALIQSLETLRDDSNLGGWLALVTRRHTWRVLQQRQRELVEELDHEITGALIPSQSTDIQRWELIEWLHGGLALIGKRCRDLLMALYFEPEQPSYVEIARRLGLAAGSIGATRARCLQRLHGVLTREN